MTSIRPVGAGVQSDCEAFISAFIEKDSVRYEDFAVIWREKKMSFIFYGREHERELKDFIIETFRIAKSVWLMTSDTQNVMCGFYLLYAFYMKQPLTTRINIRMTVSEWQNCIKFVRFITENQHWDAYFLFRELLRDSAFHFVHLPLEIYPRVQPSLQESCIKNEVLVFENNLLQYATSGNFEQLLSFHEHYQSMKKKLMPKYFSNEESSLNLVDDEVIPKIKRCIENAESKFENRQSTSTNDESEEDVGRYKLRKLQRRKPAEDATSRSKQRTNQKRQKSTWTRTVLESSDSEESFTDA